MIKLSSCTNESIIPEKYPFTDNDLSGISLHRHQSHRDSWKRIKATGPITQYTIRNRIKIFIRKISRMFK